MYVGFENIKMYVILKWSLKEYLHFSYCSIIRLHWIMKTILYQDVD
jgi:hypothetical protein